MAKDGDKMDDIYLCGAGGHAKVIIDIIENMDGLRVGALIVKSSSKINNKLKCIDEDDFLKNYKGIKVFIGVGENFNRKKISQKYSSRNFIYPNLIHPSAVISKNVKMGFGNVIMPNAVINSSSIIGNHCVINTNSVIEHDCKLGDFATLAPSSVICGNCSIGEGVYIGANASVIHSMKISAWSVIGSQATVVTDVNENSLMLGVPAKYKRTLEKGEKIL